jgi:pimeloyl-ACP methyl ester carboxylesterase
MADEQSATDARVAVLQRPLEVQGTVAAFGRLLERLATQPPSPAPDYRRIQAPTLILWGQADTTTPLALGAALQAAIKGSRLVVIPHAGHMLPLEAAPAFNAALLDFLAAGKRKK